MIYLTHTRLMDESERTVQERAIQEEAVSSRVCSQLLSDRGRYALWHSKHDRRMCTVADARRREQQLLALRAAALEQVHCTALVRYLRDHGVTGAARDQMLAEFYGVVDPREAAIAEHRNYLVAASSHICTLELLELAGDTGGLLMLQNYELTYGQFFSLFCDRARARHEGNRYLLATLIPEARANAERLRQRVLTGSLLPRAPFRDRSPARPTARPPARPREPVTTRV